MQNRQENDRMSNVEENIVPNPSTSTGTLHDQSIRHNKSPSAHTSYASYSTASHFNETPPAGIPNLGNTCYINSVLQTLFCADQLHELYQVPTAIASTLHELRVQVKLLKDVDTIENLIVTLAAMNPEMVMGTQQDAHEYLTWLLGNLHVEQMSLNPNLMLQAQANWNTWQDFKNAHPTSVTDLLYHQLTVVYKCPACEQTATEYQYSSCIYVYLNTDDIVVEPPDCQTRRACSNCRHPETTASTKMTHCPPVLYLLLMRFDIHQRKIHKRMKIAQEITVKNATRYTLAAFINHHGRSLQTGHYTSTVRVNRKWYQCNDNNVKECRALKTSSDVYILMYTKNAQNGSS